MYIGAHCSNPVVTIFIFTSFHVHSGNIISNVSGKRVNSTFQILCLCLHSLHHLQKVQFWGATESYNYLDTPADLHQVLIRRHRDGKSALVKEYLSHHPYPRWGQIVELLEERESVGKASAGLAQEVKDKYMTSEYTIVVVIQDEKPCRGFPIRTYSICNTWNIC